jgi:hypothetical protein
LFANRHDPDRDREDGLAWLCLRDHGYKTSVIEPALFQGDFLTFKLFLDTVGRSGPVPGPEVLSRALGRLVELRKTE